MGILDWFAPAPVVAAPTPRRVSPPAVSALTDASSAGRVGEAWRVWRTVGEIHYATSQQARLVGRLNWHVKLDGSDDSLDADLASELLAAGFGGDIRQLAYRAALHLQVAGGYVLARTKTDDATSWQVLNWPAQHKDKRKLDQSDIAVKVTTPDPCDLSRADSPVLAALDVAQELVLARCQARSASRSRIAQLATVIYPVEGAGSDPEAFEASMLEVMTAPLSDERSMAVVAPNLIGWPAELIEKWRTLDLTGPLDDKLAERIDRLIHQLAIILDMPPEILLGQTDANHWSSWLIQEDNWLNHIEPMAEPIGRGFADALAQATEATSQVQVTPDPSALMQRRPATEHVLTAYTYGLVSPEWVREQIGASDEDAPDELPVLPARAPATAEPAGGSVAEPQAAAVPAVLPDAMALVSIDRQAFDAIEDLLAAIVALALAKIGARIRSSLQGTGTEVPDMTNAELAQHYVNLAANQDEVVSRVAEDATDQLSAIIDRAYDDAGYEGVSVAPADREIARDSAVAMWPAIVLAVVAHRLSGRPVSGATWDAAKRLMSVAGGMADPGDTLVSTAGRGIALGQLVRAEFERRGIVITDWRWKHRTRGANAHPEHQGLNGTEFDGGSVYRDGIIWFPGDHQGCRCEAVPALRMDG